MARALIIGATGGIGRALAERLDQCGYAVTGLSRSADGLDLLNEASIAGCLGELSGAYDRVFIATGALDAGGAPPEKTLQNLDAGVLANQFAINAIGPALVLKHVVRLLPRDRVSVVGVLSARVGSVADNRLGGWYGYRAAKAALNQIVHTSAIEIARRHPQAICVALHPGTVKTDLTGRYLGRHTAVSPEIAAQNLVAVTDQLGPDQTGGFFDWSGRAVPW